VAPETLPQLAVKEVDVTAVAAVATGAEGTAANVMVEKLKKRTKELNPFFKTLNLLARIICKFKIIRILSFELCKVKYLIIIDIISVAIKKEGYI